MGGMFSAETRQLYRNGHYRTVWVREVVHTRAYEEGTIEVFRPLCAEAFRARMLSRAAGISVRTVTLEELCMLEAHFVRKGYVFTGAPEDIEQLFRDARTI